MTAIDQDLAGRVAALPWYHQIELPGGVITPGLVNTTGVLAKLGLPESLDGKHVLDVGAWDGFYSFEAARRGAARVVATDSFVWEGRTWGSKDSFDLARTALGLDGVVEDRLIDAMELSPDRLGGTFDVVLHLGVLYHLRDPVTALERAASCCSDLLVLETETAVNFIPYAAARFHPGTSLNNDPTNWYQYNVRALTGLLSEIGFRRVDVIHRSSPLRRLVGSVRASRAGRSFRGTLRSARVVLHARR